MSKLKLFTLAAASMLAVSGFAQTPTGAAPTAGRFMLYNVGAKQYLNSGENWQTHSTLDDYGLYVTLAASGNGYTISTNETFKNKYLGDNAYMDNGNACEWDFSQVEGNKYTIKNGSNYLVYNPSDNTQTKVILSTTPPSDDNGYWILVSQNDFETNVMSKATESSPVNVTSFMVDGEFFPYGVDAFSGTSMTNTGTDSNKGNGYRTNSVGNSSNQAAEQYNKVFDNYQILTVSNGKYKVTASGFYNGETPAYVYGNDVKAAFKAKDADSEGFAVFSSASGNDLQKAAHAFAAGYYTTTTDVINVTNKTLKVGVTSDGNTCTWCPFDKFKVEYLGTVDLSAYVTAYNTAKTEAETLYNGTDEMLSTVKDALKSAIDASVDVTSQESLEAATAKLQTAIANANASIASYKVLSAGTVSTQVLDNWTCSNSNTFHVNTWSTESDNTGMTTPFIENWIAKGSYLGDGFITCTLPYVENGYYQVSGLVRVYSEAGNAIKEGTTTWFGGDNRTDIATTGNEVIFNSDKGVFGTYTTIANVTDNTLKFGVEISNANFNWVAIKDVTIKKLDENALTLDEKEAYTPITATGTTVTLKRSFVNGYYNTLVLPFDLTADQVKAAFGSDAKVYSFANTEGDQVNFTEATTISANVPVLITTNTTATEFTFTNVDVKRATPTATGTNWNFVGTYNAKTAVPANSYEMYNNALYKSDGTNSYFVNGFRAYLEPNTTAAAKPMLNIGGTATSINKVISGIDKEGNLYNLAGQRVSKNTKGLLIKNGKKFFNK